MTITFGLGVLAGGAITGIGLLGYFATHPDDFEKWVGIITRYLSSIFRGLRYISLKMEVEGRINTFAHNLEAKTTVRFPRISIKWTGRERQQLLWEEGEIILVVRDKEYSNQNFINAAYLFVSEAMLKRSKTHLSKSQKTAIDLFATKKLLDDQSASAAEQFMADFFVPTIEKQPELKSLVQQFVVIDRLGAFFPIFVEEVSILGVKIFLDKPSQEVIEEVKNLTNFLENFAERKVGDVRTPKEFFGKYTRCAIKIIASRESREGGKGSVHEDGLSSLIRQGYENIYVVGGAADENRDFVEGVIGSTLNKFPHVELARTTEFPGKIRSRAADAHLVNVKTYFVHLHNPRAVKHLYSKNDIDALA